MAFTANTIFEIRVDGDDTNGGGFASGASGVDRSQQAAAQYNVTDGVTNGTTTITSATANFGTDVVGNVIYIAGGTGNVAANRYSIVSRTNNTTIVVDRSTGLTAGTGVTLKIGGALASIGEMGKIHIQNQGSQIAYIRGGTYTLTSSTQNVSGGTFAGNASFIPFVLIGYGTVRGDNQRPIISTGSITSVIVFNVTSYVSSGQSIKNIEVDGVSRANSNTAYGGGGVGGVGSPYTVFPIFYNCVARRCNIGFSAIGSSIAGLAAVESMAEDCNIGFSMTTTSCVAYSCTDGLRPWNSTHINTISYNNSSIGFNAYDAFYYVNCLSYGNGATGFALSSGTQKGNMYNCLAAYNGGRGINLSVGTFNIFKSASCFNGQPDLFNSALGNAWRLNIITPTVDPFVNRAGFDFRLNTDPNGGGLLSSSGLAIPGQLLSTYIGAVSSPLGGGGGGGVFNPLNHPLIN